MGIGLEDSPAADSGATSPGPDADGGPTRGRPVCRSCGGGLDTVVIDLGMSPPCEAFLTADRLTEMEPFYPLDVRVCDRCLLVQLPPYVPPEDIFREYAYFSSFSDSWLDHGRRYTAEVVERFGLGPEGQVVEVASNDGYLLRHFIERGIPVLGVEPARNVAAEAIAAGVPTVVEFFGLALAERIVAEHGQADLVIANNVFAHVPDLDDFSRGLRRLLAPGGVLTIEVQHVVPLLEENRFDTIYHEHYQYYTLLSAERVLALRGLRLLDVERLPTHGGSLRMYAVAEDDDRPTSARVEALRAAERDAGYDGIDGYRDFGPRVERAKRDLLAFLIEARRAGSTIAGYGAPGKGNTLLNYCGIRTDLVDYLVDRNPYKHGRFTPGTHIPIHPPERLRETRPDVILILPWNLRDEILEQLGYARDWGARFVLPIPELEIVG